ncbi:MAG: molybdopterin molybdotransferase MoeA [Devosia sp.]|uniref:molybdopterin molybdotransferase MoeA n=1 Tax=Devosia sp. TaxID=1871048 RepID=UPI001AD27391|nr:gephyrin-like molybdotransferase Glp [Devosia sp.]MBN9314456.1 molybdopterin molybdotransferase MoeA [Devosia sp.]
MMPVDEAIERIFRKLPTLGSETVPLAKAHGRVLARPLVATHSQPPFDASAMDGYAVRAAEVVPGRPLKLAGTSQAGARFVGMMEHGQCVRIFTGAPMPIGADAVIMQEEATAKGNQISFEKVPKPGQSVRRQGFEFLRGTELLPAGVGLTPAMLNLAASANRPELQVTRRPRVAIVATGDELVPPGSLPGPDQIIASNSYGLVPMLSPYAEEVIDLGIVKDDKGLIEAALLRAFDAGVDVLVTTGGASVGERDYVQEVLRDLGVQLDFWKLRMRPGKPLMFGTRGKTLVFGLPGNPVSALVTATIILKPTLRAMVGHTDPFWPRIALPTLQGLPPNGPRRHYMRASLSRNEIGYLQVTPIFETDSSHSTSLALADALIVVPEDDPGVPPGAIVDVIPLNWG